jgi:hypothetical protein
VLRHQPAAGQPLLVIMVDILCSGVMRPVGTFLHVQHLLVLRRKWRNAQLNVGSGGAARQPQLQASAPVNRSIKLASPPAGDTNDLSESCRNASGGDGISRPGLARWQLDLLFQILSKRRNITAGQNFACCKS